MPAFTDFLRSESGTATVNWVVLTAGLTGLATALAFLYSDRIGQLNFNMGANIQNRETRPSYAYLPHDILRHDALKDAASALSSEDLGIISAWGNAVRPRTDELAETDRTVFEDLDNAITVAYGARYESRGEDTDYRDRDVERVLEKMGLGSSSGAASSG